MKMKETHKRSIAKAATWRIWVTIVTVVIVYVFTKRVDLSIKVGLVEIVVKTISYYFHERIWADISWGRG